jgi:hypothetical protein
MTDTSQQLDNASSAPQIEPQNIVAEKTTKMKIEELKASLSEVCLIFKDYEKKLKDRLNTWVIICAFFIILVFIFYYCLFNIDHTKEIKEGIIVYKSIIRLTSMALILSALAFSLKMIKSYMNMIENVNHKQAIISSMATLVESSTNERDQIYSKMIELIIKMTNTGIFKKESGDIRIEAFTDLLNKIYEAVKK